jgi:phosphoglycerate dehydrogenase-like enzyme
VSKRLMIDRVLIVSENAAVHEQMEDVRRWLAEAVPGLAVDTARSLEEALAQPSADALISNAQPWLVELVRERPSIRWIHLLSAGADRLLELDLPFDRLLVSSSRGVHAATISEYVLGAALHFMKGFGRYARQQQRREWTRGWSSELEGGTLGIVGLGTIGAALALRARAFGMRVIGLRRTPARVDGVDAVFGPDGLSELMAQSDVVAVILPLTPQTRGFVDRGALDAVKPGAVFVNVGRGHVVDEAALVDALRTGRLLGAALDVFAEEPLPSDSPFWGFDNVLITPHVAGTTPAYMRKAVGVFGANHELLRSHGRLATAVELEASY